MQKITFILFLIFIANSWAQAQEAQQIPVEKINQFNEQNMSYGYQPEPSNPLCPNCKSQQELYSECKKQVCKQNYLDEYYNKQQNSPFKKINDLMMSKIQEQYQKIAEKKLSEAIEKLDRAIQSMENKNEISTPSMIPGLLFSGCSSISETSQLYPKSIQNACNVILKTTNAEFDRLLNIDKKLDLEVIYDVNFPNEDPADIALQETWKNYEKNKKFLEELFPFLKNTPAYDKIKRESARKFKRDLQYAKDADRAQALELYMDGVATSIAIQSLQSSPIKKVMSQVTNEDVNQIFRIPQLLNAAKSYKNFLLEKQKDKNNLKYYYSSCIDNIESALLNLPSPQQIENFSSNFEAIKRQFKEKIYSQISSHSQSILDPHFEKTKFIPPKSNVSYAKEISKELSEEILDLEEQSQDPSEKYQKIKNDFSIVHAFGIPNPIMGQFEQYMEGTLFNFECEKKSVPMIRDRVYASESIIKLSWGTFQIPEMGQQILTHEWGHKLSRLIADTGTSKLALTISETTALFYKNLRSCVSQYHMDKTESLQIKTDAKTHKFKASLYSSEDLSDTIAAILAPKGAFFAIECSMLSDNYTDNPLYEFKSEKPDPHSTILFRTLRFEAERGTLPQSCKDFLKSQGVPFEFKSCWPSDAPTVGKQ